MRMSKSTDISQLAPADELAELRARLDSLTRQNDELARQNASLTRDLTQALTDLKKAYTDMDRLIEQIKLMSARAFGSKSEKVAPNQLPLFNECEFESEEAAPEPAIDSALPKRKDRRRGGKRVIDFSKFDTEVIEHDIPADERRCHECEGELVEMNVEVTRKLKIIPAHLVVEEHRRHVYKCMHCCGENAKGEETPAVIVRAAMPEAPIPGSFATSSLLAWIAYGKYVNSLPLYRIEADLHSLGANISRQNMANWMINIYERWLSLIHARMKQKLLERDVLHADETGIQVLKEPKRSPKSKSYMWLFASGKYDIPIYIFEYHETRSQAIPNAFLANWNGYLTTDGYQPYFTMKAGGEIVHLACLVHIRRKFADIIKAAGGDEKAALTASVALEARRLIDEMFAIDKDFDEMTPEARHLAREKKLKPKMEAFKAWVDEEFPKASPRLALERALKYARKYFPYTMNVLKDGRLELDNNLAERAIRPFAVGRRNWLFSDTPKGADASAAIYSVMTTAKMNGLNPRLYLEWLLDEMPNAGRLTDEVLDGFMPWSEQVPTDVHLDKDKAAKVCEMADTPIVDIDPELFDSDEEE